MIQRRLWQAGLCALGLPLCAGQAAAGKLTDEKVRLGVLSDMSGLYADTAGEGSVHAARMAIEDFGGRVLDKPIELVSGDHQNKPDVGTTVARTWYDRDGVDAIFDVNNSAVALALNNIVRQNGKIVMNTGGASVALTNEGCAPTAVHYTYDTYALANGAALGVTEQGGKTWFVLGVDYAFGKQMAANINEFVGELGGTVIGSVFHPLSTNDFSSFIMQAQASKAHTIALANATNDTVNSVKTAQQFGVTKGQRVVPMLMFINDVHALGLENAQGMTFASGFYWNRTPETRAWSRRFFEKMKKMPSKIHAGTYSAVMHYLNAVKAAETDDGPAVASKMKEMPINDFFAQNGRIRADGRMVHDMYLVQVKSPADSKEPWDYYEILSTIPGDKAFQPLSKSKCPLVKQ